MRGLIKATQYTMLLYIQASHASDSSDDKVNRVVNQSVKNSHGIWKEQKERHHVYLNMINLYMQWLDIK